MIVCGTVNKSWATSASFESSKSSKYKPVTRGYVVERPTLSRSDTWSLVMPDLSSMYSRLHGLLVSVYRSKDYVCDHGSERLAAGEVVACVCVCLWPWHVGADRALVAGTISATTCVWHKLHVPRMCRHLARAPCVLGCVWWRTKDLRRAPRNCKGNGWNRFIV